MDKIGQSFDKVLDDVQKEAQLVEKIFISDIQKSLNERKSNLSPPGQDNQRSSDSKGGQGSNKDSSDGDRTSSDKADVIKFTDDDLEKELEAWLKEQNSVGADSDGKGTSSEDYFKSIVNNVQGYIE